MPDDPDLSPLSFLGTVTRSVESLEHEGAPAKAVVAERVYPTTPDDLWDAITNPERLPRWFLPVTGDLRLGGAYQLEGNASGTVTACEPPTHLGLTWEWAGTLSWVRVDLAPDDGGTRLTLRHIAPVTPFWTEFGPGAAGVGWEGGLWGLLRYVHGIETTPEDSARWMASPEAKDYYRASAAAWGEVAIASGEPEDEARAAAARTAEFYAGDGPAHG